MFTFNKSKKIPTFARISFVNRSMSKKIIVFLLMVTPLITVAQRNKFKYRKAGGFSTTKTYRGYSEIFGGIGAANFLGEVGGADAFGTNFVRDIDFVATRPSLQVGARYHFRDHWSTKVSFFWFLVNGDDANTYEQFRRNRNLKFRSNILELSGQVEFFLNKVERNVKRKYKIKGTDAFRNLKINVYGFMGAGVAFFNPKAKYDGKWRALQPLGTEGQGLSGAIMITGQQEEDRVVYNGPAAYRRFTIVIPFGIGFKQVIDKYWSVGLEIGARKTYTDYIDDVSTNYYDNDQIREERGDMAADLADPMLYKIPEEKGGATQQFAIMGGADAGGVGRIRGDLKDFDSYLYAHLTVAYILPKKLGLGKRKRKRSRGFY